MKMKMDKVINTSDHTTQDKKEQEIPYYFLWANLIMWSYYVLWVLKYKEQSCPIQKWGCQFLSVPRCNQTMQSLPLTTIYIHGFGSCMWLWFAVRTCTALHQMVFYKKPNLLDHLCIIGSPQIIKRNNS